MKPERWKKIEEIYGKLLEQPEDKYAAFLSEVCGEEEEPRPTFDNVFQREREHCDHSPIPSA